MTVFCIDNTTARRYFLHKHLLAEPPVGPAHGAALSELLQNLGFVQIDSINTVARAHDLILFSRRPRYRPRDLSYLIERDRAAFEHWTHDAAVVPMAFYPAWALKRRRDAVQLAKRWPKWGRTGFDAEFDRILTHIGTHGATCSSALGPDEPKKSGGWWDWHPAKTALEYLWRSGRLEICHREGFRKYYDLTERVVPDAIRTTEWSETETIDWLMRGALSRLGFATSGELAAFWDIVTVTEAREWCAAALARGELIEVDVIGAEGSTRRHLAFSTLPTDIDATPVPPNRMRVLSPFDPALRDRARAERLFGFDYRIEVFVPAAKRRYGYYVFPLLEGDRIVGRIDMKADRKADVLNVTGLWPEPGVRWGKARQARLEAELDRITRLAGVARVDFAKNWRQDESVS